MKNDDNEELLDIEQVSELIGYDPKELIDWSGKDIATLANDMGFNIRYLEDSLWEVVYTCTVEQAYSRTKFEPIRPWFAKGRKSGQLSHKNI